MAENESAVAPEDLKDGMIHVEMVLGGMEKLNVVAPIADVNHILDRFEKLVKELRAEAFAEVRGITGGPGGGTGFPRGLVRGVQ